MSDTLLAGLRAGTGKAHEALDRTVHDLGCLRSRTHHIAFLRALGGCHRVAEAALRGLDLLTASGHDRKSHLAETDLERLSGDPALRAVPDMSVPSSASLLGVLYVVEGSTLGARQLVGHPDVLAASAGNISFLSSYGDETIGRWRRTAAVLRNHRHDEAAVESARQFFALVQHTITDAVAR